MGMNGCCWGEIPILARKDVNQCQTWIVKSWWMNCGGLIPPNSDIHGWKGIPPMKQRLVVYESGGDIPDHHEITIDSDIASYPLVIKHSD